MEQQTRLDDEVQFRSALPLAIHAAEAVTTAVLLETASVVVLTMDAERTQFPFDFYSCTLLQMSRRQPSC